MGVVEEEVVKVLDGLVFDEKEVGEAAELFLYHDNARIYNMHM